MQLVADWLGLHIFMPIGQWVGEHWQKMSAKGWTNEAKMCTFALQYGVCLLKGFVFIVLYDTKQQRNYVT